MGSFSWLHLAILIGGIAIVCLILVLTVRSWRRRSIDAVISITLTASAFYAAVALIGAVITFVNLLTSSQLSISVPVSVYWPQALPGVTITGPTATMAGGGFTRVEADVDGASGAVHVLWAAGQALGVLVPAAIAALIALACFQLLRGSAFAPVVARAAAITAIVVLIGGTAAEVLSEVAGSMASTELFAVTSASAAALPEGWDLDGLLPRPALDVTIPLWPIGAMFGFAALAAVLRYGSRLQRDTELLV